MDDVAANEESRLLDQARSGDADAFERVLSPYLPMLLAYSRAICGDYHTAQDVVQNTALIAYRNLNHLFPEADFAAWLKAIARRQALAARRSLTRVKLLADDLLERAYEDPSPSATGPYLEALTRCLEALGGRMAEVVQAHYFQGAKLAAAAEKLELSASAAKQLLYRARLRLRDCVQDRLGVEHSG